MYAVIPARNVSKRIGVAIQTVRFAGAEKIIVVANGCEDSTLQEARALREADLTVICFREPLGFDVPRAVGAAYAYRQGAEHVLFYDGDLIGHHRHELQKLVADTVRFRLDLSLTDTYGTAHRLDVTRNPLLRLRSSLNRKLGLEPRLGLSSPSHGPHIVSRRLLRDIPAHYLAIPPLVLAYARQEGLTVDALAHIPHSRLGSAHKEPAHFDKIRETIIGDLLEAHCLLEGRVRTREYRGHVFDGYHSERRFDLLDRFLNRLVKDTK
ncbi:glycosyl transferase family 2 [Tumebacillus sp. BK434]|uniref:glycosyltransferase family A protein n=1 Tax=Tumebacillus sp. BK434 TaxID=2512169 RepID=UPI0010E50800|nr:glycosyltransferase family A protein [Tumebacillus sp. BK434]TCP52695.1 glycosyl transferase family 2 [Tumebacillus sp. BK434]